MKNVNLTNFDTSKVTNMWNMFYGCNKLKNINVSNFNTSNVTNMSSVFGGCSSLSSIDVSNFNTSNVTSMSGIFSGCSSLSGIDVSNFDTSKVTSMSRMFSGCKSLSNIDVSNFDTSNVLYISGMFGGCSSLSSIDISNFDTSNVTDTYGMSNLFKGCSKLVNIDLSNFDTSNVRYMNGVFSGCSSLTNIDVSNFDTSKVEKMDNMFEGCSSLTNIDVSNFNTSHVSSMSGMFKGCSSLINVNLSNFNASNVYYMNDMFKDCSSLTNINVSNFNTHGVKTMESMFSGCKNLKEIDLSSFDISYDMENISGIFDSCVNLKSIKTPINKGSEKGELPKIENTQWVDVYENTYDYLPGYIDHSITLNLEELIKLQQEHITLEKGTYEYTGSEIRPEVIVKDSAGTILKEGTNYTLSYKNDVNAGTAEVEITGKGKYIGTVTLEFTISPKELKSVSEFITLEQSEYKYTGDEIRPKVSVKDTDEEALVENEDYIVSYENNINAGIAKAVITGKGNYTGTVSLDFVINPKEFGTEEIVATLESEDYEYTGQEIQPVIIIKDGIEKLLTENVDYTVLYKDNIDAGVAEAKIIGKGNYTETISILFTINPKEIAYENEDIDCDGKIYQYTGEEIRPISGIKGLVEGSDYEIYYKDNIKEGTATVTVVYMGNYRGAYMYHFTIVKEPIFTWDKDKCTSDAGEPEVAVKERTNSTCVKEGRILYVATLEHMGKVYTSENEVQLPATGKHSWDKGVVKGSKLIYTCKVCKQTQSVERKVKSIAITGLSHNIAAGKKVALTATVLPANAINKKVVWTTSNKKVATVSQRGIVSVLKNTGKKSVIITATAADGSRVKQSFKITSMKGVVTKISLSGKNTLAVGKSQKVKAKVKASAGAYKSLKWTSSNVKYATVSSNGTVKAQKAGKGKKVTITAMALDGSGKKATFSIKIK